MFKGDKMKKLYGIGTGPGDKELLTLKAVRAMKESAVIFAPNNRGENMAINTAREFIENKKIVYIDLPMGSVTQETYKKAAETIINNIPKGEVGAFLTIGDPMIYSTFTYIMDELEGREIEIEVVSGIPSFIAAAASMKLPLTTKGDNFILCDELEEESLKGLNSVAILKTLRNKEKTINILEKNNFKYKYIKRVSFSEEKIIEDKEKIIEDRDYISLIIAKKDE